jgi:hypothetical protein
LRGVPDRRLPSRLGLIFAIKASRIIELTLLGQVQAVLVEYDAYLPLTCRQVFYRLVGAHGYYKTERAYDRLCEMLNRARRAQIIDVNSIRDDGGSYDINPLGYQDADHFIRAIRRQVDTARLDRQQGQPVKIVLACEAEGMRPQLQGVVQDYGVPVISGGGFDSTTSRHALAEAIGDQGRPVEILHIGDHDPSGAHLFLALSEDVEAFLLAYDGSVDFTRLAVTPDQITDLSLPTAPAKTTDVRAFTGQTCQAEAIPPDVLAEIVRAAVEARLDLDAWREVIERETEFREDLQERLQ